MARRRPADEIPAKCLELSPTRQSVAFGGVYLNLSVLAKRTKLDRSYLSRIFSCARPDPSVPKARLIAGALGMSLQGFLDQLEQKRAAKAALKRPA